MSSTKKLMGGEYKKPKTVIDYELLRGSDFYTRLPLLTENPWDELTPHGWQNQVRSGYENPRIVKDYTAPHSADNVLEIPFRGAGPDSEPCVIWFPLPSCTRFYCEYWIKLSANWQSSPAGFCKQTFTWPSEGGDMYDACYGNEPPHGSASCHEYSAMKSGGQLQWGPNPTGIAYFSNTGREVLWTRDQWTHHAYYLDIQKKIWRWWVNDSLCGDYSNIPVPTHRLIEWQIAMTVQEKCEWDQFAWYDHVILRGDMEGFKK